MFIKIVGIKIIDFIFKLFFLIISNIKNQLYLEIKTVFNKERYILY